MELLSEQERAAKRSYRRILIVGLVIAVALAVWFMRPPQPVDLRFLSALGPRVSKDDYRITITFNQSPADVKKLLAAHLSQAQWDIYAPTGSPYGDYRYRGRRPLNISVETLLGTPPSPPRAARPGMAIAPATVSKALRSVTTLNVNDPTGIAILP